MNEKIIPEILNRKSSVCFSSKSISPEELDLLIEATKWAPSSRNMQPWKIIFVSKKDDTYKNVLMSLSDSNQIWAKNAEIFAIFAIVLLLFDVFVELLVKMVGFNDSTFSGCSMHI